MTQAEPLVQPIFSKFFSSLVVVLPIWVFAHWLHAIPSRLPGADRVEIGRAQPVLADKGMRAWRLTASDPRFGGLSALTIDRRGFLALTDSGVTVRFARPGPAGPSLAFAYHDLPGGPGKPTRKSARDSESLLRDPAGRGWWVAFESKHSLWLYDAGFRRVLEAYRLRVNWSHNKGGEGLLANPDGTVMVVPESGGRAAGGSLVAPDWTSDASRMPDGRVVLLVRQPTWHGFANRIEIAAGAGRPARRFALALRPLDNMEGIATEALPGGGTRLWIVSDDNFRPWMRTLLVAIDLPARAGAVLQTNSVTLRRLSSWRVRA